MDSIGTASSFFHFHMCMCCFNRQPSFIYQAQSAGQDWGSNQKTRPSESRKQQLPFKGEKKTQTKGVNWEDGFDVNEPCWFKNYRAFLQGVEFSRASPLWNRHRSNGQLLPGIFTLLSTSPSPALVLLAISLPGGGWLLRPSQLALASGCLERDFAYD